VPHQPHEFGAGPIVRHVADHLVALTNSTLRARLGISEPNKAMASRIISDAVKDGRIKPEDPRQGKKYAKYIPFWA